MVTTAYKIILNLFSTLTHCKIRIKNALPFDDQFPSRRIIINFMHGEPSYGNIHNIHGHLLANRTQKLCHNLA